MIRTSRQETWTRATLIGYSRFRRGPHRRLPGDQKLRRLLQACLQYWNRSPHQAMELPPMAAVTAMGRPVGSEPRVRKD